jgi:hypothetical protein
MPRWRALGILQCLFHVVALARSADPRLIAPHAVALLHDLFMLGAVVFGTRLLRRRRPAGPGRSAEMGSVPALCAVGMLLAVYPQVLREYLAFPVNLFAASAGSASVMVTEYLGVGRRWPALAAIAAAALALRHAARARPATRLTWLAFALALPAIGLTLPSSPNPWVVSIRQSVSGLLALDRREVRALDRPPAVAAQAVGRRLDIAVPQGATVSMHVFLLVLEGVTAQDFEREFLAIADGLGASHGDWARSCDAENYRVPLLVVGPGVTAGTDTALRSHLDLPAIVAAVMGRSALPAARSSQLPVESSGRWV